jgi:hypothetical protein
MADAWLPWSAPTVWPPEAVGNASCDAQIYRRCGKCGAEMRIMAEFAGVAGAGSKCDRCGAKGTVVVRHLEKVQCRCASCGGTTSLMLAGNEELRCDKCGKRDLKIESREIVPPFPQRFTEAIASHAWGVSGEEDARAILTEIQAGGRPPDADKYMLVATRFCRRLRLWGGYSAARDRAILRNIEANVLRNYFRATGEVPAGVQALELFEAAVKDTQDPEEKALEQHNCAMAVYSMLARNSERDVILATGRNDIRQQAIAHAQRAKEHFASARSTESRIQTARILHIIGDLYRAGGSNERELKLSLENLDAAAAVRGIPKDLLENIKMSRRSTQARVEAMRNQQQAPALEGDAAAFDNPKDLQYSVIRLEGDAEKIAEDLIRDSLPKTQLDEIDVSNEKGLARLFACLMLRQSQASLEKDEIIRFVQRNHKALQAGALDLLTKLAEVGSKVEGGEKLGRYFQYFGEAVSAAIKGQPQDINLKSDRLLWLVYALAQQLSTGKLSYRKAQATLSKSQHKDRISQLSLIFMLQDYAESINTANQTPTEYVLLILECAILSGDAASADAASSVLGGLPAPRDPAALVEVMGRARKLLVETGRSPASIDETVGRYAGRFDKKVADDDL